MAHSTYRKPVLIIPACGNSQRFRDVGIGRPKGLIRWDGKTMIEHVVPNQLEWRTIVVVKKADEKMFRAELPLGFEVLPISSSVGQMDTVLQALDTDLVPHGQKIIVVNCDDKFPAQRLQELADLKAQAGVLVFETEPNARYGYIDHFPEFSFGAEKNPISRYALAGAFMFKDKHTFAHAVYGGAAKWHNHRGEYYLSHLFEHINGKKEAVLLDHKEIIDFGTPEALSIAVGHDIVSTYSSGTINQEMEQHNDKAN